MAEGVLWSASYGRGSGVFNFQACSGVESARTFAGSVLDSISVMLLQPFVPYRGVERLSLPNQYSSCRVHFPDHSPNEPLPRPTETSMVHRIDDDLWSWVHYRLLPAFQGEAGEEWGCSGRYRRKLFSVEYVKNMWTENKIRIKNTYIIRTYTAPPPATA